MKSTLTITRTTDATFAVEHPDDWTPEQVEAAAQARLADINGRVRWWSAGEKTDLTKIAYGVDAPDVHDMKDCCHPSGESDLFELDATDLERGTVVITEAV